MVNGNKSVDSNYVGSGWGIKAAIIVLLLAAVGLVVRFKNPTGSSAVTDGARIGVNEPSADIQRASHGADAGIPRLVDLGADKCIPCKMMAPILEELREEYTGKMEVAFIDVWKNPSAAGQYGIRIIPTQIFYDPAGRELFRHEGFISKEDILRRWNELGINLEKGQEDEKAE